MFALDPFENMKAVKGPLCTYATLVNDFKNLGILSGETLLLHSSLSSIGWVCGGAEVVIQALLDVLGPRGTLVVPTQSGDNSDPSKWESPPVPEEWWQVIRESTPAYNPLTTRTRGVGVIAETLRTWPGARRSAHPQTSFAAVGFHARAITAEHALDCQLGEKSPLARLEHVQARVLLLGVGFDVCTAFHLAEYRTSSRLVSNSFAVMNQGRREWVTVQDQDLSDEGFKELGLEFGRHEDVTKGLVGAAEARYFKLESAVMYATLWLRKHRKVPSGE